MELFPLTGTILGKNSFSKRDQVGMIAINYGLNVIQTTLARKKYFWPHDYKYTTNHRYSSIERFFATLFKDNSASASNNEITVRHNYKICQCILSFDLNELRFL